MNKVDIDKKVYYDCLKHGEKCIIKEENNEILGILLVVGYKGKFERKYVKMLTKHPNDSRDLFRGLQWENLNNLFIKSRKNNIQSVKYDERLKDNPYTKGYKPSYFARRIGFRIIAVRDKEILLKKEEYKYEYNKKRR